MRRLFTLILLCTALAGVSQRSTQQIPLFTIRGGIGIPKAISSQQFRKSFAGLYEGSLSGNFRMFNNVYVGLGYQNTGFQNNRFLKQQLFNASVPYNTRLTNHGIFLRLGYDKFFENGKGYFDYALNTGFMICNYSSINADTSDANKPFMSHTFSAPYLQPEVSVNFIAERNLSFFFMLSYTTLLYQYDARAPRFNQFSEIQKAHNRYMMTWLNVAVGFNILINNKKS